MHPRWYVQLLLGIGLTLLGAALRQLLTDRTSLVVLRVGTGLVILSGIAYYREAIEIHTERRTRQLRVNAIWGQLSQPEKEVLRLLIELGGLTESQIVSRLGQDVCNVNHLSD